MNPVIPSTYRDRRVYHFTPLAALAEILTHGLLSRNEQAAAGLPRRSLAWESLQAYRATLPVPAGPGGVADDYVPFYFCKLSPMLLAVIVNKTIDEEEIIHLEFTIQVLEHYPAVFTDAALSPGSTPHFFPSPAGLEFLDWRTIDSREAYPHDPRIRQARLAELLVHRQIPVASARRIIVWDDEAARQVAGLYAGLGLAPPPIETDPGCYFYRPDAVGPEPAVSGPLRIRRALEHTLGAISASLGRSPSPAGATQSGKIPTGDMPVGILPNFIGLEGLCAGLRQDFACLPETAGLVGLETDNRAHSEDVGAHTHRVVAELLITPEYGRLSPPDRILLEVAAYLHDIGKGPKSRWAAYGGRQQIDHDHPVKALPMLERIFTQEITGLNLASAALVCKLVAYHDLVGGIIYGGRRLDELLSIVTNEVELDMLVALSKADAAAINPTWGDPAPRDALKKAVLARLKLRNNVN